MLSEHENKLLCEVGPGTPMGELLRRFWLPVVLSEELPAPDCDPVAVKILGEELVAFRDSDGRTGLIDAYCPHRHAALFWGRNEECGLRCTYHGWKYDVDGHCIDMPNEPADSVFKDKVRITAYPTREAGGCVWAYMGPADKMPDDVPHFEWARVPEGHRFITKRLQLSSWAQAVEGGIDSSHVSFLHGRLEKQITEPQAMDAVAGAELLTLAAADRAPRFWVSPRDFGFMVAARRNAPEDKYYWRLTPFMLPAATIIPGGDQPGRSLSGHFWVPVDDQNCWTFSVTWNAERPLTEEEHATHSEGMGIHTLVNKDVSMWDLGLSHAYLPVRHRGNNYQLDRREQREETFTGIKGISEQDMSIQESMGRQVPRWLEHLGTADKGIIEFRKTMLGLVRDLLEGKEPEAATNATAYGVRSAAFQLGKDVPWEEGSTEYVKARA